MHTARSPKSVPVRMDPPDVVWEVGGEAWVTGHLPATAASLSWCLFSQRSISTPPRPTPDHCSVHPGDPGTYRVGVSDEFRWEGEGLARGCLDRKPVNRRGLKVLF